MAAVMKPNVRENLLDQNKSEISNIQIKGLEINERNICKSLTNNIKYRLWNKKINHLQRKNNITEKKLKDDLVDIQRLLVLLLVVGECIYAHV